MYPARDVDQLSKLKAACQSKIKSQRQVFGDYSDRVASGRQFGMRSFGVFTLLGSIVFKPGQSGRLSVLVSVARYSRLALAIARCGRSLNEFRKSSPSRLLGSKNRD